jgi:hypothetical protein
VSLGPITNIQQTGDKYWWGINDEFEEQKHFRDFKVMHMEHNENAMSHRWGSIQSVCNKFYGFFEKLRLRPESGNNFLQHTIGMSSSHRNRSRSDTFGVKNGGVP